MSTSNALFSEWPIPNDFREGDLMIIFDRNKTKYSLHRYLERLESDCSILRFENLMIGKTGLWSNNIHSPHLLWLKIPCLPPIRKKEKIKYKSALSRFQLMDL